MVERDFSHLTNDELINGIKALNLPDYIRSKGHGVDVRETLAQMTEMTIQLGVNMGLSPDDALNWARKLQNITAQLAQKANKTELNAVSSQIDNLVAHAGDTDNNSELLDIRVSSSGVVHDTAGTSVRKQIQRAYKMADEGKTIETKEMVIEKYSSIRDSQIPELIQALGKNINEDDHWHGSDSTNFLINVVGHDEITFPVFKTTGNYGVLFTDVDGTVIETYSEKTLETGSMKVLSIPPKASAFLLVLSKGLYETDWHIELNTDINQRLSTVEAKPIKFNKNALIGSYENAGNQYFDAEKSLGVRFDELDGGIGAYANYMIDVSEFVAIEYSVFKTSSGYGSLILNDEGIVIWSYAEAVAETGSLKEVILPAGSKTFVYAISNNLSSKPYELNLYKNYKPKTLQKTLYPEPNFEDGSDGSATLASDLALCSMVTKYKKDKKPFHEGYLFHRLRAGDESLYYGDRMDKLEKIGEVDFNTNNSMLAISPKDKRVVATERGVKGELYVWDGVTTHVLFNGVTGPKGWLYNSGVDFIEDENGDEYCIFAEYGGDVTAQAGGFYVWRGKFPYTSESDWEKVLFQDYGSGGIDHFHMVRKDPWTNLVYLTSGDWNSTSKWWYSEDDGKTWTMFARGSTSGFEEHVMRCINFIFTEDYVYWAVDHGVNHSLNRIKRNTETGILDLSTREMLTELPEGQATNSITYSHYPEGIFMFDRWDYGTAFEQYFHLPIKVQFWDIEREELVKVTEVKNRNSSWGGHRGQAYINYTNPYNPYPAIGFSDDTRNPFEVPVDNPSQVGTIYYDISGGSMNLLS